MCHMFNLQLSWPWRKLRPALPLADQQALGYRQLRLYHALGMTGNGAALLSCGRECQQAKACVLANLQAHKTGDTCRPLCEFDSTFVPCSSGAPFGAAIHPTLEWEWQPPRAI
jgi:hypothetical protein